MVGGASRAVRSDGHRNASVRAVLSLCSVQPEGPLGIYSGRAAVPAWHLLHDEYHSTVRDIFSSVHRFFSVGASPRRGIDGQKQDTACPTLGGAVHLLTPLIGNGTLFCPGTE